MARINRGRSGGGAPKRAPLPSSGELLNLVNKTGVMAEDFMGATTAVSKVIINSAKNEILNKKNLNFYDPTTYDNLAGEPAVFDKNYDPSGQTPNSRPFYEVVPLTGDEKIPGEYVGQFADETEDSSPAPLTLVPTSTTNPKRPRTVAAGYDDEQEKLTVMFRDGTLYNYYDVNEREWQTFKANRSKGAVIYRMLDFKPRGYADETSFTREQLKAFYRITRGIQVSTKGQLKGQGGKAVSKAARKKGGKNPAKKR